jgi:PAS domain S-box-containing protein
MHILFRDETVEWYKMNPLQVIISLVYFFALLVLVGMSYISYRERGNGTTNSLFYMSIAGIFFIGSSLLVIASSTRELMQAGLILLAPAHWLLGLALALFTLHFTGYYHRVSDRVIYFVYGIYLLLAIVSLTNPLHHLILSSYGVSTDPFPYVYGTPAIGLPILLAVGYASNFAIAIAFILAMFNSSRITNQQFLALGIIAGGTSFIHFAEYIFYEPTFAAGPFGFSVVFLIAGFGYLVLYKDLLTLDPISRTDIVSSLAQPIIITDPSGNVIDYNNAAQTLFPGVENSIGKQIENVNPNFVESVDSEAGTRTYNDEFSMTTPNGEYREYQLTAQQITKGEQFYGTTIVLNDITELKMYSQDLEQQTGNLEDFTSFVSHDLRNPIATSRQYIGLLEGKNEEERRYLKNVDDALERMDTMIENLLTLTREGQAIEERDTIDLSDTVNYAWRISDTQDATLESHGLANTTVYADKNRLYTLFENLFRNAAEHAGTDTKIIVGVLPDEDGIYIADNGPGLPDSINIFKKGATTSPDGTGLGLAIVERIVEAHGWEIEASEFEETGGAKFTISGIKSLQKQQPDGNSDCQQSAKM